MATYSRVLLPVKRLNWVTPATIGLLLILRLIVLGLGEWLLKHPPVWLDAVYDTGTYLLTLFFIWWERDRLSEYHIGALAVGIILIFKPLQTLILLLMGAGAARQFPMAFPNPFSLIVWAAALVTLAWWSRSVATSMATHAAMNALGMTLGQVVAYRMSR